MVEFSPVANEELREAILFYDDAQAGTGDRFSRAVDAAINDIVQAPMRFAVYEGKQTRHVYRRVLLNSFPYMIIYQAQDDRIRIVAVVHASRAPGYWEGR